MYQTTKPIKSLARGGVNVPENHPVTAVSFTPDKWAALLAEGAIVEVAEVAEVKTAVTKPARKKAVASA